jgi:hypothetical protein
MARSKRGALGNAIRAARLRKQAEVQNTESEMPAMARGKSHDVGSGSRAEQSDAHSPAHAKRGRARAHRDDQTNR